MQNNDIQYNECDYINCIGVDNKIHRCLPWETKTECGISNKKVTDSDYSSDLHYWCSNGCRD